MSGVSDKSVDQVRGLLLGLSNELSESNAALLRQAESTLRFFQLSRQRSLTQGDIAAAFEEAFPGHDLHQESIDFARAVERKVQKAASAELLFELQKAHQIIRNALNLMTTTQKAEWARRNDSAGLIESGTTRFHERAAAIAFATGAAK